ncbi:hypothetical protein MXB_3450 [Myxobolus squamalis]|nr:hypothetical protein MXB_3450 [Myxobolus squamalis]
MLTTHVNPSNLPKMVGKRISLIAKLINLSPNGIDGEIRLCDKSEITARFPVSFRVSCSGIIFIMAKVDKPSYLIVEKVIEIGSDNFDMDYYFDSVKCIEKHNIFFS